VDHWTFVNAGAAGDGAQYLIVSHRLIYGAHVQSPDARVWSVQWTDRIDANRTRRSAVRQRARPAVTVTEAWIGFAGAVVAAIFSGWVAVRQSRMDERLTQINHSLDERLSRLNHDLDAELHRREAVIDQEMNAEDVLARYREPLAAAAFDLQSRLYNILTLDFERKHGEGTERAEEALRTTVFRLNQYLGWREILRRDIQFLSFPEADETRRVAHLLLEVSRCLLSDEYGHDMMIWSDQQRALGEQMIVDEHGTVMCMGYARFRRSCDGVFAPWCERMRVELGAPSAQPRLRDVQNLLCQLVEMLDEQQLRYDAQDLQRA
jgi:hypothetical protein